MPDLPLWIEQAKIDAPDFPRPDSWWRGFLPNWIRFAEGGPLVRVEVTTRRQHAAAARWLHASGNGRLAAAIRDRQDGGAS